MFDSKKAEMNILFILLIMMVFSVILILGIIFAQIFYVAGHDFAVLNLYQAGVTFNGSQQIQDGFENTVTSYQSIEISKVSDNIWFFSYFTMSLIGYMTAYRSRSTGIFSFLSILTFGILFILYIFSFFLIIMNWLYFDILTNLFVNVVPNLPKLEWWINNGGIIFLLQASTMLLVKVIDFDFSSWNARRKKESDTFDNEIV